MTDPVLALAGLVVLCVLLGWVLGVITALRWLP